MSIKSFLDLHGAQFSFPCTCYMLGLDVFCQEMGPSVLWGFLLQLEESGFFYSLLSELHRTLGSNTLLVKSKPSPEHLSWDQKEVKEKSALHCFCPDFHLCKVTPPWPWTSRSLLLLWTDASCVLVLMDSGSCFQGSPWPSFNFCWRNNLNLGQVTWKSYFWDDFLLLSVSISIYIYLSV